MAESAVKMVTHQMCSHDYGVYNDRVHIKVRIRKDYILGSRYEFCGAFYHVYKCSDRWKLNFECLSDKCRISKRKNELAQPRTVVAVVKCGDDGDEPSYEARYTNCYSDKMHAEDYFKRDVEEDRNGGLKQAISNGKIKKITMYITLQPCHLSVSDTNGTREDHSCCDALTNLYENLLQPKDIQLSIKPTHISKAYWKVDPKDAEKAALVTNAKEGIRRLFHAGITVTAMKQEDWEYLWGMVVENGKFEYHEERIEMDKKIEECLDLCR